GRADVAVVGTRRARRGLRVGRAARPAAGAHLRRVALARRAAADDEARLEHVGRTRAARPVAGLVHVAGTRRRAAGRAGVARRVLAGVARAVARVGRARVTVVGAGGAARLLRVGGATGPVAGAEVVGVALVHGAAAERARGLEGIVRARGARPGTRLGEVADAGRGATGRARVPRRMLAGVARAVAGIRRADVAVVGARRAVRLLRIGRAVGAVARTVLGEVALPRRRAAGEGDRLEGVVRTRAAAARAGLGDVAPARRRGAAGGPRVARVV